MAGVYVASKLENYDYVQLIQDCITAKGAQISYDWAGRHDDALRSGEYEVPEEFALAEMAGVRDCDALLVALPGGRGTHVEFGLAYAWGKPIVVLSVGSDPIPFYTLPGVEMADGAIDAISRVVEYARRADKERGGVVLEALASTAHQDA